MRADQGGAAGGDPPAPAQRRPGRRDALGRHRLERRGRGYGAAERRPGEDVLDRLRRWRLRRDRKCARGRAHVRHRAPRGRIGLGGRRECCRGSSGTTASPLRTRRPSPPLPSPSWPVATSPWRSTATVETRTSPATHAICRFARPERRRPSRVPPVRGVREAARQRLLRRGRPRGALSSPTFLRSLGDGIWLSVMRGAIPGLGCGPGAWSGCSTSTSRPICPTTCW